MNSYHNLFDDADLEADLDDEHPHPFLCESDDSCSLHFDRVAVQSEMKRSKPDELVLGYTRTMMAFLLFNPAPHNITMIGLGGGSLAKYCHTHLPEARITVVEINPRVIALRNSFLVPPDSSRFKVICMDGAKYVRRGRPFDVLLVDGFDHRGQAPELCSQRFYDDCYAKLKPNGVLVANLLDDDDLDNHLWRLRKSFKHAVALSSSEDNLNKVAFAFKGDIARVIEQQLPLRQKALESSHDVNLRRSMQSIRRGWIKAGQEN